MKKFIILILAALLLGGCGEKEQTFENIYQIIQYRVPGTESKVIPAKFNVVTGTTTPLCIDPLCSHGTDSGCILKNFLLTGPAALRYGYFYFTSWDIHAEDSENVKLCRYDPENEALEELWEHSTDAGFQGSMTHLITEEALYFRYTETDYSTWTEEVLDKYGIQYIHPTKNGRLVYNTKTGEINDYPETSEGTL